MRGFIVLCLSAMAMAAPQGYNYNPAGGVSHGSSGFGSGFGSFGGSSGAGGSFQGGHIGGGGGGSGQGGFFGGQAQQQAIISKRFYIHSAPEDAEEDYKEKHITVGVPKKNYNVVFIKSPAKSNKKTSIKISPAVNEEKTVIYVLSKKTDSSDVHAEVIDHPAPTTKPEVFFIKYKTNEEAAHAQQEIQAQYDALGGSSQVTDEGVAPVSSVIGSLDGGAGGAGGAIGGGHGHAHGGAIGGGAIGGGAIGGGHASNAYLPPNFQ